MSTSLILKILVLKILSYVIDILMTNDELQKTSTLAIDSISTNQLTCWNRVRSQQASPPEDEDEEGEEDHEKDLTKWRKFLTGIENSCMKEAPSAIQDWVLELQKHTTPMKLSSQKLQNHVNNFKSSPKDSETERMINMTKYRDSIYTRDARQLITSIRNKSGDCHSGSSYPIACKCYVLKQLQNGDYILSNTTLTFSTRLDFELKRIAKREEGCTVSELSKELNGTDKHLERKDWEKITGAFTIMSFFVQRHWFMVLVLLCIGCYRLWPNRFKVRLLRYTARFVDAHFCQNAQRWYHNTAVSLRDDLRDKLRELEAARPRPRDEEALIGGEPVGAEVHQEEHGDPQEPRIEEVDEPLNREPMVEGDLHLNEEAVLDVQDALHQEHRDGDDAGHEN